MFSFLKPKDPMDKLARERSDFLSQDNVPEYARTAVNHALPDKERDIRTLSFLVIDFETTGFDPKESDIISMGWIEINQGQVDLSTQQHFYIGNQQNINHQTAVINHIVPQMVQDGRDLDQAIESLLQAARGKILVAHGKVIEQQFIDHYLEEKFSLSSLPLVWIDTLRIEKWRELAKGVKLKQDNRLNAARERYNLPQYATHNALIDAIGCAELLLAQSTHIFKHEKRSIARLYKMAQ